MPLYIRTTSGLQFPGAITSLLLKHFYPLSLLLCFHWHCPNLRHTTFLWGRSNRYNYSFPFATPFYPTFYLKGKETCALEVMWCARANEGKIPGLLASSPSNQNQSAPPFHSHPSEVTQVGSHQISSSPSRHTISEVTRVQTEALESGYSPGISLHLAWGPADLRRVLALVTHILEWRWHGEGP